MTKRELYKEMFPDREAKNSNKHYSRFTLPELLKVKAQWAEREMQNKHLDILNDIENFNEDEYEIN